MEIQPKGTEALITVYEIGGIGEPYSLALENTDTTLKLLDREIPVRYAILDGKAVKNEQLTVAILGLSFHAGEFRLECSLQSLTNLKFNLVDVRKEQSAKDFYGKVVKSSNTCPEGCCVRFTSLPPGIEGYFQAVLELTEDEHPALTC